MDGRIGHQQGVVKQWHRVGYSMEFGYMIYWRNRPFYIGSGSCMSSSYL